ncbi:hypothetical protein HHK36_013107 [Tetracentron sinense]|uniref:3'-5' exonuclease n=1 Tax=Tetracentron sinense TaxID=13715 RepID=A0A834Z816_TETSI|nr:hypothetical protein HHK36_013107 [Tetracentron sinense]
MESGAEPSLDWEKPMSQDELDAIEAAFDSASSSSLIKRTTRPSDHDQVPSKGRRLPDSMLQSSTLINSVCPRNRGSPFSSSHQVNLKMRYPTMNFGGQIIYCRTVTEVERATMELLEIIEAKKRNMDEVFLGFDIEWRPTFRRGAACRKAAVMQICGDTSHCYVMHIIHSGIPPILQSLLEDSASLKVGVCIANDAVKVLKDYNVCIKALEDLSSLANLKLGGIRRKWSLSSLTEMLTCKQLEKPNKIRLGDWEADVLSRKQLQYAATDAFVSWYLCQEAAEKDKRKLEKDLEDENEGAGVYSAYLKKHYILANDRWIEDIKPEILNGHNV